MRFNFESQKQSYSESDIQKVYQNYLVELISDFQNLYAERKRIKVELERRQREEDELKGYKWPEPNQKKKQFRNQALTYDQKLQQIEEERNKEQKIQDCFAKEAIRFELERRLSIQESHLKEEKSQASRKKMFQEVRKKAAIENKKVSQKLKNYQNNISDQIEEGLRKSKSFYEKLEARDILIQKQRAKQVSEIANRNRKLEEKINNVKDDFENRMVEELYKRQSEMDQSFDFRQMTAEQMEKNKIEKQQLFEQKLNLINSKIKQYHEEKEFELFNRVGQKMEKAEKQQEEHDKQLQNLQFNKRKQLKQRFSRHKKRYQESEEQQQEKMTEWMQKISSIQERVDKFKQKKNEEQKNLKEQRSQSFKEHLENMQCNRKSQEKDQTKYFEKHQFVQTKLKRNKEEQEQLRTYLTISRQKFEKNNLLQFGELSNLKYSSSVYLLNKLKDIEDEDKFADISMKFNNIKRMTDKTKIE
ncbi:unnamed protein product [Paramecium primaurelia]|uniref:Uncharacterized protein n=1 Tax=Paramecium primaurelia TaxID=5886 RepID=A0A8S1LJY8_PARPR|nr:unnamed protein product [Paramecium primaurelia]